MKTNRHIKALALTVIAAALLVPLAQASSTGDKGVTAQLVLPVQFGSTSSCAEAALYDVVADHIRGTGTTCLLTDVEFSPCGEGLGFCRDLATHSTLSMRTGTIELDANQHEVITAFDPGTGAITFEITWTGTVASATLKYHKLVGAPVSGGGSTSFDSVGNQTGSLAFLIDGDA